MFVSIELLLYLTMLTRTLFLHKPPCQEVRGGLVPGRQMVATSIQTLRVGNEVHERPAQR